MGGKTTITSKGSKKKTLIAQTCFKNVADDRHMEKKKSKVGDDNAHHFWSKNPWFLVRFPLIWWFFAVGFVPSIRWTRSLLQIFMGPCYDSQLLVGKTRFYQWNVVGLKPNMGLKKLKKKNRVHWADGTKTRAKNHQINGKHSKNHGFFDQKWWAVSPTSPTETIEPAAVSHNMGP